MPEQLAAGALTIENSRRFLPSLCDFFFVAVLIWLFVASTGGWSALLGDGDTGWHIRTGEYILDHRSIPTSDLFSFTKPGAPWFAWEWLSDVIFAGLFRLAGFKAIVLFSGACIGVYSALILRYALWRGASVLAALPFVLIAIGSSTVHFLARPHLFTLLFTVAGIWMLERDRRQPGKLVWLLVPGVAVWTNLHGGFAIFLVLLFLLIAGLGIESLLGNRQWEPVRRYTLLLCGSVGATLINPFGVGLHVHIIEYLKADWIRNLVQEFQAPTFRSESQLHFELLLLAGLILCGRLLGQIRVVESLWILFLAHSSLTSLRHAPLYAAVASPLLAEECTRVWAAVVHHRSAKSIPGILFSLGADITPLFRRFTVWSVVAIVSLAIVPPILPGLRYPTDFPAEVFPVDLVARRRVELSQGRILTTDQWADYLIFHLYPSQTVFLDGRSDFYGEKMGRQYLALLQGDRDSLKLLQDYKIDQVLIPVEWPLASILKSAPGWHLVEDNGKSILFKNPTSGLMKTTVPAEGNNRSS